MKRLVALLSLVLLSPIAIALAVSAPIGDQTQPSPEARAEVPADLLEVYVAASYTCGGLPWQILAGIGWVESHHAGGTADPRTGDVRPAIFGPPLDGRNGTIALRDPSFADGWAHAVGPMQLLPSTFARWATVAPDRPPGVAADPQNAWDAIFTAAAYLCAGRPEVGDVDAAIRTYNHSDAYVRAVRERAAAYGLGSGAAIGGDVAAGSGEAAVAAAMTQLGVHYQWGASSPEDGFDCSGLVQWAYAQIGVSLPRTTQGQVSAGVAVDPSDLRIGDLVFTRSVRAGGVVVDRGHVALYAGGGMVIVAPHTGDVVKVRPLDLTTVQAARRVVQ